MKAPNVFYFIFYFLLLAHTSSAQYIFSKKWAVPQIQYQYGREIFLMSDGGFLLQATVKRGFHDCYLLRTDINGDTLWTQTHGTDSIQYFAHDMARTADGNFVLCGDYQQVTTSPSLDSYVQKVDSNGNEIWLNNFGYTGANASKDFGELVGVLGNGNIVVEGSAKGYYSSLGSFHDILQNYRSYLSVFTPDSGIWTDVISVCHIMGNCYDSLYVCSDMEIIGNNIFWLGRSQSGPNDFVLINFNKDLDTLFTIRTQMEKFTGLAKTSSGELLLFGKGQNLHNSTNMAKYDTIGNQIWFTSSYTWGTIQELIELSSGELLGISHKSSYISPFWGCMTGANGNNGVYLNKYNSSGDHLGFKGLPLPVNASTYIGFDITETSDNLYSIIGTCDEFIWHAKTDTLGFFLTHIQDRPSFDDVLVYPQPAQDYVVFDIGNVHLWTDALLQVFSSSGQLVFIKEYKNSSISVPRDGLPAGLYFYRISTEENGVYSGKLIFE